eukprot:scaffold4100_cov61-Phaeocystis_antarctica.AAC.3
MGAQRATARRTRRKRSRNDLSSGLTLVGARAGMGGVVREVGWAAMGSYCTPRVVYIAFVARPAYCTLTPLRADASAMACSRSAAGPLPTRAEKSESGRGTPCEQLCWVTRLDRYVATCTHAHDILACCTTRPPVS